MRLTEFSETQSNTIDGTYVAARFSPKTIIDLETYQADNDIPNPVSPDDFHTTIVHSVKPIFWRPEPEVEQVARPDGWQVWDTKSGTRCLVLLLDSPYLHQRFQVGMDRGAAYDFDEYRPHITLSYDVGADFKVDRLSVPEIEIEIANEYVEPLQV